MTPQTAGLIEEVVESIIRPNSVAFKPGTKIGTYEILELLGVGGMGEVYRARDTTLHSRQVAIKVLPETFSRDPERVSRFEREALVLASLNHAHIGAIYHVVESNASRFLVLELVEGGGLAIANAATAIWMNQTRNDEISIDPHYGTGFTGPNTANGPGSTVRDFTGWRDHCICGREVQGSTGTVGSRCLRSGSNAPSGN